MRYHWIPWIKTNSTFNVANFRLYRFSVISGFIKLLRKPTLPTIFLKSHMVTFSEIWHTHLGQSLLYSQQVSCLPLDHTSATVVARLSPTPFLSKMRYHWIPWIKTNS